jgi:hypothetical protein
MKMGTIRSLWRYDFARATALSYPIPRPIRAARFDEIGPGPPRERDFIPNCASHELFCVPLASTNRAIRVE